MIQCSLPHVDPAPDGGVAADPVRGRALRHQLAAEFRGRAWVDSRGVRLDEQVLPLGRCGDESAHMFVDDYRQGFVWRRPEAGLAWALRRPSVVGPDFSVWTDDPPEWRFAQAWRGMSVCAYWQRHGVVVVPVLSFGTPLEMWSEQGGTWAVRGHRRCAAVAEVDAWVSGLRSAVSGVRAAYVYVFGTAPRALAGFGDVVFDFRPLGS